MTLYAKTAVELLAMMRRKEACAREIVESVFQRIEAINDKLNAFVALDKEGALKKADEVDRKRAAGEPLGELAGIPVGIKDNLCNHTHPTTCASNILQGYNAAFTGTAVRKLHKADAVIIGNLNMDEFAMGSSCETSFYGPCKNPWNLDYIPGGSSGGSAAAVAADMAVMTLGSDTGGSIRQPASLCGVVGMKPTYGRVSRFGLVAFASSLDQIGPITKTAEDNALLLKVISGHDTHDSTSIDTPVPDYLSLLDKPLKGLKIGIPKEYFIDGMDADVEQSVRAGIDTLKKLGAETVDISLPHTEYAVSTYYIIATAEASSNLARFDGVRYGNRTKNPSDLKELYYKSRSEGFGDEVKRRILLGTYVLSSGYYDAYYKKAQKVRTLIRQDFTKAFEKVDCIITPVSPTPAFKLGEKINDPLTMYLGDIFTISINLAGLPALSVPCGFSGTGLPIGMQIIGKTLDEERILQIGHVFEKNTLFHKEKPALG
ncbi:MAG: Asp-tRNA(Asn)/Glu-tRNA(Gln) amidotransferase subunit GatA [Candidatus Auribacterota bacterium]